MARLIVRYQRKVAERRRKWRKDVEFIMEKSIYGGNSKERFKTENDPKSLKINV